MDIQTTAVIRERGQLTIPDKIRQIFDWINPDSIVTLRTTQANELIIQPHTDKTNGKINWKEIWDKINLARSFSGKQGRLSQFIIEDRYNH